MLSTLTDGYENDTFSRKFFQEIAISSSAPQLHYMNLQILLLRKIYNFRDYLMCHLVYHLYPQKNHYWVVVYTHNQFYLQVHLVYNVFRLVIHEIKTRKSIQTHPSPLFKINLTFLLFNVSFASISASVSFSS